MSGYPQSWKPGHRAGDDLRTAPLKCSSTLSPGPEWVQCCVCGTEEQCQARVKAVRGLTWPGVLSSALTQGAGRALWGGGAGASRHAWDA